MNSSFGIFLYRFDENNDGAISHKEMKKFVKDIQSLLTPSDLENISEHNLVKAITKQASVSSVVEFYVSFQISKSYTGTPQMVWFLHTQGTVLIAVMP